MDSHLLTYIPPLAHYSNMENSSIYVRNVFVSSAPKGLDKEFIDLLTSDAIDFLVDLAIHFDSHVNYLHFSRLQRKSQMEINPRIPKFKKSNFGDDNWRIAPVSGRVCNRHLELGDVSPSSLDHFITALHADVQGIQVDFDDGHCPTWFNQIYGLHNVVREVRNSIPNAPDISEAPILMLRPRAWNMIEHNMSVNGKEIPAPLFDFGLLIFHNGRKLHRLKCGPYFYLSKIENHMEARLWNDIFIWTEQRLRIPHGAIKACVLIENILSVFEMDHILYELRDHSLGLNCGIWDYAASIIAKFGGHKSFLLPDRNKYVNMSAQFLKKYMQLVVKVCHKRGAHVTGGMVPQMLIDGNSPEISRGIITGICDNKVSEIQEGIDGFMVYDVRLVPAINRLWQKYGGPYEHQLNYRGIETNITEKDLLTFPQGGVTLRGLKHNISVTILFINSWLNGKGHFIHEGAVEDSATAEISRSQIWQWMQHGARLEDDGCVVTRQIVILHTESILEGFMNSDKLNLVTTKNLPIATDLFFHLINCRYFPDFITTFISNSHPFRKIHSCL